MQSFDKLKQKRYTFTPGEFRCGSLVAYEGVEDGHACIVFGPDTNDVVRFSPDDLRELANFFSELADDIQS